MSRNWRNYGAYVGNLEYRMNTLKITERCKRIEQHFEILTLLNVK